ncbi:MAG: hypothetical protein IJX39_03120 [Clostridia bacterium]|nr:hypothetical protein [Clostridia bacterium]
MKEKDYLKKIGIHTCIYYTAATFLILFLYFILNTDLSAGVQPEALICILPFALLFACANILYKYAPIKTGWKVLLHYILTLGGAFCCLYLPNKDPEANASQGLILFLALSLIYIMIMGIVLGLSARIRRVMRDESHYKSVYKQGQDDKKKTGSDKNGKNSKSNKKDKDDYQNVFKKK